MKRVVLWSALAVAVAVLAPTLRADVKTREKSTFKMEGMLGAWKARCAPFNVNYRYMAEELRHLLVDSGAKAVVVHDAFAPTLAEVLASCQRTAVVTTGEAIRAASATRQRP